MTAERGLTVRDSSALPMATTQDAFALAQAFAQSGVLGARNPAEGVMALKVVMEEGLVRASQRYNIRQGSIGLKYQALAGDFIKAGGSYRIIRRDAECAELVASFGDTRDMTFRVTWAEMLNEPTPYRGGPDAQMAELRKPVAERKLKDKYATPRARMQMLWARLISDMVNALAPNIGGLYPPEIVDDIVDDDPLSRREPVEITPEAAAERLAGDGEHPIDYTICPPGFGPYSGKAWTEIDAETLTKAAQSEKLNATYKAAIRYELQRREEDGDK